MQNLIFFAKILDLILSQPEHLRTLTASFNPDPQPAQNFFTVKQQNKNQTAEKCSLNQYSLPLQ